MAEKNTKKQEAAPAAKKQDKKASQSDVLEQLKNLEKLSLNDALVLAQLEMENPPLNGENHYFTKPDGSPSKYALLSDILNVVRPACNRWGIAINQKIEFEHDKRVMESTSEAGTNTTTEQIASREMLCTVVTKGSETKVLATQPLQGYKDEKTRGSQLTYFRRQHLCSVFGLAGEEVDVSENTPSREPEGAGDSAYDRDQALQREYAAKTEKLDELKERLKVAKALGIDEAEIKEWTKENIGLPSSHMSINQLNATIEYTNALIKSYEPIQENIDF